LNVPSDLLYYYGTTVWFPRRLDVATRPVTITTGESLGLASAPVDPSRFPELRRLGYTHIITMTASPQGLRVFDLRAGPAPGAP
jgi:hypothetical protein